LTEVKSTDGVASIRSRVLSRYLETGGSIIHVRMVESVDGEYSTWVSLADRPGEFRVSHFHSDAPRTFRDPHLAIQSVRKDYGFIGEIILMTDRRAPQKGS